MSFGQKYFEKKSSDLSSELSDIRSRFQEIKEKEVEKAVEYDIINLRMRIGCGCGGAYDDVHVAVPKGSDFPYYDGSTIQDDDIPEMENTYGISFKKGRVWDKSKYNPSKYRNV